ncbi:MAG: very short patch repair endonuclease [Aestuariivirga sp.]|uniref:very short patch repair endonuclease n=1 Tax=Aestuariivirga sp. TaxID=2650926 RepID=UPI0038D040B9
MTKKERNKSNDTAKLRSRIMRAVGSKATSCERAVRDCLRPLGLRMRYNVASLPGKPDIVIPSLKFAIFVHGCFWHGHGCKRGARAPKTNAAYWTAKIAGNRARDRRNAAALRRAGWSVISIWECDSGRVRKRKLKALQEQNAGRKVTGLR